MKLKVSFISKRVQKYQRNKLYSPKFIHLYIFYHWLLPDAILCIILVGLCIVFYLTNSTTLWDHFISFDRSQNHGQLSQIHMTKMVWPVFNPRIALENTGMN